MRAEQHQAAQRRHQSEDDAVDEMRIRIRERRNHPCLILIEGGEEALLRIGCSVHQELPGGVRPASPGTCGSSLCAGFTADQKRATEHMQTLRKSEEKLTNDFSYGNYYGFFPEISSLGE